MPKDPREMTLVEIERRRFCHKANEAASQRATNSVPIIRARIVRSPCT